MTWLPVALSLLVSFESSIMYLGYPAEGYIYGIQYIWMSGGFFFGQMISIWLMVEMMYPLKLTSAYEVYYNTVIYFL